MGNRGAFALSRAPSRTRGDTATGPAQMFRPLRAPACGSRRGARSRCRWSAAHRPARRGLDDERRGGERCSRRHATSFARASGASPAIAAGSSASPRTKSRPHSRWSCLSSRDGTTTPRPRGGPPVEFGYIRVSVYPEASVTCPTGPISIATSDSPPNCRCAIQWRVPTSSGRSDRVPWSAPPGRSPLRGGAPRCVRGSLDGVPRLHRERASCVLRRRRRADREAPPVARRVSASSQRSEVHEQLVDAVIGVGSP